MPVLIENLICFLGLSICAMLDAEQSNDLLIGIYVLFCLGQLLICEILYRRMKFKQMLGYESVYLMTNFLFALVFRLLLRASVLEATNGPHGAFIFYVVFSAVHWSYMIIRLGLERLAEGPPVKKPEDLRYGLIRDEDAEDTM